MFMVLLTVDFKFQNSFTREAEGRDEQRRILHMEALMQDMGTGVDCRHRVFVRTGKTLWK